MHKTSLNGTWQFTKQDPRNKDTNWDTVTVPHTWNNIDGQDGGNDYYRGICFYRKTVEVDDHNGPIYLEFEGVNSIATVYWNGTELGTHKGGYSTFRFDVTSVVNLGANDLLVMVDNRHHEDVMPLIADFTFYGGIYRDCSLVYTSNLHFDLAHKGAPGVYVSQTKITDDQATFRVDAYIKNEQEDVTATIELVVLDATDKVVLQRSHEVLVSTHSHVSLEETLADPILWNGIRNPYLYQVRITLLVHNTVVDERIIPTGFRYFHMDDEAFYLNGTRLRLNGVSRHQDRWQIGNALTKEMHEQDMAFITEIGANSIRLAHYQHNQYFYDLCDQAGMIVWAEIPYITRPSKSDETGSNAKSQLEELIKQNYNHSSIVMWGVQNEITAVGKQHNVETIVRELHDLAKANDPYRLTTQAQVAMHPVLDSMNTVTDVVGFNQYFGWYSGVVEDFKPWLEDYRKANPNRPLCLSEYGVEGIVQYHTDTPQVKDYSEEYHALWHEKAYEILSNTPFVWGTYVWNMFTFAADFRDEGGVKGLNNKGLVNFDRTIRKDAFYFYKAAWNPEPMVHLCQKRFIDRPNRTITLKAYSNQDHVVFELNGIPQDLPTRNGNIITLDVTLQDGVNHVSVFAGELHDEATFVLADHPNPAYAVPEADKDKGIFTINADNWIDSELHDQKVLTIDPVFYSVADRIQDLLDHAETEAVFDKYLGSFREHPMFEMAANMSIKMIHDFDPKSLPLALVLQINDELQQFKKL